MNGLPAHLRSPHQDVLTIVTITAGTPPVSRPYALARRLLTYAEIHDIADRARAQYGDFVLSCQVCVPYVPQPVTE